MQCCTSRGQRSKSPDPGGRLVRGRLCARTVCLLVCRSVYKLCLLQSGARLEALRPGGARRRPAGRQRAVREARRLAQEQVLAGEPQVDDRHGRRRPHPRRHDLLELFPPAGPAADVLPASAAAAATGPGRRAGGRVGGRG